QNPTLPFRTGKATNHTGRSADRNQIQTIMERSRPRLRGTLWRLVTMAAYLYPVPKEGTNAIVTSSLLCKDSFASFATSAVSPAAFLECGTTLILTASFALCCTSIAVIAVLAFFG